ncbi:MAG: hypothetical protein ABSE16_12140 [Verrucomicrobiota bacterium]|jgi:hypothetical protein
MRNQFDYRRLGDTARRIAWLGAALAGMAIWPCRADDTNPAAQGTAPTLCPVADYFENWFDRVTAIQNEQPHWVTPLVTVTPRLEEELRYDQYWESVPHGRSLDIYGAGKGLELIPGRPIEVILGVPAYETESTTPTKSGWADENLLLKYRILSANEQNGNYILTAFFGMSIPTGGKNFSSGHYTYTPTLAGGKGWGNFDFQSTLGVTLPDNLGVRKGAGTPVLSNTALQYRVEKYFWPEVEANYTYWPNGEHEGLNQLFLTPGLLIGRLPIYHRVGVTFGAGCEFAVTDKPLVWNNFILTARIPF